MPDVLGIGVAVARDPARALVAPGDRAAEVDAPRVVLGIERQRLERNRDLRDPALLVDRRGRVPDAFPVPLLLADVLEDAFLAQAVRIRHEAIAAAPVVERVEQHREPVVAEHFFALPQDARRDLARVAVVEARADVDRVLVVQQIDDRALGWPARTRSVGSRAGPRAGSRAARRPRRARRR